MIENLFRKELKNLHPYVPGKPAEEVQREFGLERIEKLASNENQFGPSPKAVAAIEAELENCNFYPEPYPAELTEKLSITLNVPKENIVAGISCENMIRIISLAFIEKDDEIIVPDPSFSIYEIQADIMGGKTIRIPFKQDDTYDIDAMLAAVTEKTKLMWLCTPNNPTGNIASKEQLDYLVSKLPDHVVLILDEAYYEFACAFDDYSKNDTDYLKEKDNIIILRSFSKIYGIAGLRTGYTISSVPIVNMLNDLKLSFEVHRLAQVAAAGALDDIDYLKMIVTKNKEALDFLEKYFDEKGWHYYPSYANFIWVDVQTPSKELFEELQKKGVIIRPGFLWGWDTWIRVSTGRMEQMEFFKTVMDELLG